MDLVLHYSDKLIFTPYLYPEDWPENNIFRQWLTLMIVAIVGGNLLYLSSAGLNFLFVYDKRLMKHHLFLKNQIMREIKVGVTSIPIMGLLSSPFYVAEVRGYSKLHTEFDGTILGFLGILFNVGCFIVFTDSLIYWIHRGLHQKWFYKSLHKVHHYWKVPTPFASHAFHPVDGFVQSSPYLIFIFLFPMHKLAYLTMYFLVNIWTVSIHDADFRVPLSLRWLINGSAHHTDHHLYYNYNYGQFFTIWDKIAGSFKIPSSFEGDSPIEQVLKSKFFIEESSRDYECMNKSSKNKEKNN